MKQNLNKMTARKPDVKELRSREDIAGLERGATIRVDDFGLMRYHTRPQDESDGNAVLIGREQDPENGTSIIFVTVSGDNLDVRDTNLIIKKPYEIDRLPNSKEKKREYAEMNYWLGGQGI